MKLEKKEILFFCLSIILSIFVVFLWFSQLNFHVFMGDDLYWIRSYHSNELSSNFWINVFTLYNNLGKFRPLTNVFLLLSTEICQIDYDCFFYINLIYIVLNTFLVSLIAYKVTAKWGPSIFISSVVFIFSRFSYYFALQVWGIMENLSLMFVLLMVFCLIQFKQKQDIKWIFIALFLYLLTILTHERFIVLIVPLLFFIFIQIKNLKYSQILLFLLIVSGMMTIYLFTRNKLLSSSFFVGTSDANVLDTFEISQFISFMFQGIFNLFGFNVGPDYLSGRNLHSTGAGGILVGLFLSVSLVILIYLYIKEFNKEQNREVALVYGLIITIGFLLVASSITIRQDYRWLYAPFAVFILLICLLLGKVVNKRNKYLLGLLIVVSFLSVDIYYRQFVSDIYYIKGLKTANSVKMEIISNFSKSVLSTRDIYLITYGNIEVYKWYLANDYFFKLYANIINVNVNYFDSWDAIPIKETYNELPLIFQVRNDQVTKIPDEAFTELVINTMSQSNWNTEYDFINNFSSGILNDSAFVDTPTGRGIFMEDWQESSGPIRPMITIIGPSNIHYPSITCQKGSMLTFRAGMPFATGDGGDLYVDIVTDGINKRIIEAHFDPANVDYVVNTTEYRIPISSCSGDTIDLIIGVESLSGDSTADWIALTDVKLVVAK